LHDRRRDLPGCDRRVNRRSLKAGIRHQQHNVGVVVGEAAVISDQDAADLYAYVRQMPAPRDPNSIPPLNAKR